MRGATRLQWAISLVVGAMIAASCASGEIYFRSDRLASGELPLFGAKWLVVACIAGCVTLVLQLLLERMGSSGERSRVGEGTIWRFRFRLGFSDVALWAAVLLALWTPWILLMQPTAMGPDTIAQILWSRGYPAWDPSSRELIEGATMSDHHPVFATLIYGLYDKVGIFLGSEEIGYRIHGIVQAVFMAASLSTLTCFMHDRLKVARGFCIGALVFYGVLPVFGCMSQVMVKDLLSMPFFVWWVVCFCEYARRALDGEPITWKFLLAFTVTGVLGALMRKTLFYIELLSLLVLLIVVPRRRKLLLPIAVPAAVMLVIMPMVVFPLFNIAKGGTQETIAVPLHQTVSAYIDHGSEMSEGDVAAIGEVLDLDTAVKVFTLENSDTVKDAAFRRDATTGEVVRYLAVWAKQAFIYPGSYARAIDYMEVYTFPGAIVSEDYNIKFGWPEFGGNDIMPQYPMSYDLPIPQSEGQAIASSVVFGVLPSIPVVGLLVQCCLYYYWLPLFTLASCVVYRRKRAFVLFVPFLLTCCVFLLCPASQPRYGYNLLYCAPLILSLPFFVRGGLAGLRQRGGGGKANDADAFGDGSSRS